MKRRRGVSLGTVIMVTLTVCVLLGFFLLLPHITGARDLRINASELVVALDRSLGQLSEAGKAMVADQANDGAETALVGGQRWPVASMQPQSAAPNAAVTPQPTATPVPVASFTLCAAGSLKFNAAVQKACTDDGGYHFDTLLEEVASALNADLTIATLEEQVNPKEKLSNSNIPADLLTAIRASGINALCLGHFAVLDSGISGLQATKDSVRAAELLPYGAYTSPQERNSPTITQANGVSVALLSYQSGMNSAGKKKTNAEEQAYAVASLQLPVIEADIQKVRAMGAQVVVVSLCWGRTGDTAPSATQKELAQAIADAGADVILGTRAEAVQSVQVLTAQRGDGKYHPTLCAFNLGNLFTYDREKRVSLAGVLLHAKVMYDPASQTVAFDGLTYTPTYCWRGKLDGAQRYRVLNSAQSPAPEYVGAEQQSVMERCLKTIADVMEGSGFTLR